MCINGLNSSFSAGFTVGSLANANFQNSADTIYAKEGEPTYLKDMDYDEDGVVTFEEFKDYCKENELSSDEIKQLLAARTVWKLLEAQEDEEEDETDALKINYDDYLKECENEDSGESSDSSVESYVDIEI